MPERERDSPAPQTATLTDPLFDRRVARPRVDNDRAAARGPKSEAVAVADVGNHAGDVPAVDGSALAIADIAEVEAVDARASEVDEDHRTNLARFRIATAGGLIVCVFFVAVDWLVVTSIHPGRLSRYLELRAVIALGLACSCAATLRKPAISVRALRAFDLATFSLVAAMITLMCVEFGGISSPYYAGVILVLVCRAAAMPTNWRHGLLYFGVPAAMFPGMLVLVSIFEPSVAEQFEDPHARSLFALNGIFIASALLLVIVGSHAVWSLRRQLYATRHLGRYRLKSRIGSGGMGEVWKAHHAGLKRDVAIKILRTDRASQGSGVARFEREVAATVRLTHPHTVRVFDHGVTVDGLWYYAMELLEGEDLKSLVNRNGPLPHARVVLLMTQAGRALAEAHAAGIVHRDIKPANLFVTTAGGEPDFLKVLDFGIAKIAHASDDATLTNTGWLGGTPDYMSPELVMGRSADARTDVYSLGAVMYFLLTGGPPFRGGTVAEVLNAHVNRPPAPPSIARGDAVPEGLEAIVMRCLAKDPAARFANAKELSMALAACDLGATAQSVAPARPSHAGREDD